MSEKIQLLNPNPSKKGAVIDRRKYETVKETILDITEERGDILFTELMDEVVSRQKESFEGSSSWYCTAVKLDLEARRIIERIDSKSPQIVKMAEAK
ncbi:MAG TPA: hypothetical protein VIG80_04250 [Bacillaceae bacterium]